jgi:CRISPR-associated protein Cas1
VSHYKQAGNLQAQLSSTLPLAKQLWKQLVQAKIMGQHQVLDATGNFLGNALAEMAGRVKSGDPENMEAQAARRYWPLLMGNDFTRNPDTGGANSLLNYGYAILRATVARAVISVGLHPSLGVHHQNRLNAFCLVDDLMEPYRPTVDYCVFHLLREGKSDITSETKKALANLMEWQIAMPSEITSISNAILYTAQSLVQSFNEGAPKLVLPQSAVPKTPITE